MVNNSIVNTVRYRIVQLLLARTTGYKYFLFLSHVALSAISRVGGGGASAMFIHRSPGSWRICLARVNTALGTFRSENKQINGPTVYKTPDQACSRYIKLCVRSDRLVHFQTYSVGVQFFDRFRFSYTHHTRSERTVNGRRRLDGDTRDEWNDNCGEKI